MTTALASTERDAFVASRLEAVFQRCFLQRYHTELVGGAEEPLYQPAGTGGVHRIFYRSDYFASALHEVAHWCIAGPARRRQVDFGYWYQPDGRGQQAQRDFESVEDKPQALEWYFSLACGYPFRVSVDNLHVDGSLPNAERFKQKIVLRALSWQQDGLPARAAQFYRALGDEFGTHCNARALTFTTAALA